MLYPFKSGAAQRFCLAFGLSPIRRQTTSLEQLLSLQRALCLALLFNRLPFPPLVFTSFFGTMVWADFWMGCTTKELLQRHNCNSSFSAPGILRYQKATSQPSNSVISAPQVLQMGCSVIAIPPFPKHRFR
ncbi:MAG: hypothetical protein Q4E72_09840 [bacterium]|nr:hypothetical protein [bacterium]